MFVNLESQTEIAASHATKAMDLGQDQSFCFSHLEDNLHEAFASALFVEDTTFTNLFQQLDGYCETTAATTENGTKPLVVVGEYGVGKSAALATWAARRKSSAPPTRRLDYSEYVFWHTIGCSKLSTQVTNLLRRLVNELIFHFDLKETMDLADDKLSWVLPRLLDRASKKGRVIIVIDGGLQHISSNDTIDYGLKWLPLSLPPNVKMIIAATIPTSDGHALEAEDFTKKLQAKVQQTWNEIQRRKWPTISLESLQSSCVASFIDRYLSLSSAQPPYHEILLGERKELIEIIGTHRCATNPLFLTFMLRGIFHAISSGYNIDQCLAAWMPCRTAAELIGHMLSVFQAGMPRKSAVTTNLNRLGSLLGDALSLLFVARHGLHENELFELLGRVKQTSRWNSETKGTNVPVKLKILKLLMEKKNRLIDIFRSFDTDGNGTLSHEEFYTGMERLDIDVSHDEVTQLIHEVDTNGDGEIDYQETLDHFEHLARSYSHGKRRVSVFVRNAEAKRLTISEMYRKNLINTLKCVGVSCLDMETGSVLTLPLENTALRDVIWTKYIIGANENNEAKSRTFIIEYFSKKQPTLRYCEELPWHLKKCRSWPELKKILVDLRTLDIMYNSSELKAELFNYLRILSIGRKIKFDIVREYNRSMDRWCQTSKPSASQISMMSHFIAVVMAWFSKNIAGLTKLPPFLRDGIKDDYLLHSLGIDLSLCRERGDSGGSRILRNRRNQLQPEAQYFFNRWIWIQFPWLALKNASMTCQENSHQLKEGKTEASFPVSPSTEQSPSLRDKAMIQARITEPNAALMKFDKMESTDAKRKCNDRSKVTNELSYEDAVKQLLELKHIHDSLAVETYSREKYFNELVFNYKGNLVGDTKSQQRIVAGEIALGELQSRLDKIHCLIDTASRVDLVYQNILLALHSCDPSTQNQHLKLEQQLVLCRQQITDLQQERDLITKDIECLDTRSKMVSSDVKLIMRDRQKVKPLLDDLRFRVSEESERKKSSRVNTFDPLAFSRRVRLEGRIAKRRATMLKQNQPIGICNSAKTDKAAELHPMERLAKAAGTHDPASIADILQEDETKLLRERLKDGELQVKEQVAKLELLLSHIKDLRFADHSPELDDDALANVESLLSSKQKRLESITHLVQSISLAILNLSDKVPIYARRLSEFSKISRESARLDTIPNHKHGESDLNVKKLAQLIKSLHDEVPPENLFAKKETEEIKCQNVRNVRVLNRKEQESTFAKVTKQLHELEDKHDDDSEQDADEDFGKKLASYVNHGIQTNASINQQRRANLLSHAKQGKYASKGIVLEAVLDSASKNQSP